MINYVSCGRDSEVNIGGFNYKQLKSVEQHRGAAITFNKLSPLALHHKQQNFAAGSPKNAIPSACSLTWNRKTDDQQH